MKFRDNLLYQRQQRNMTQEQLAMLLGVSRQSVAKWEAGQSTPEVDKLLKMSELFGCSLDDLVNGDLTQTTVEPAQVLPTNAAPQDVCGFDEHVRKFSGSISRGVLFIILGVAVTQLLSASYPNSDLCAVGVFAGVILGLVFIIPSAIEHAAFTKAHPFIEDFYTEGQKAEIRKGFARDLVVGIGVILAGFIVVIGSETAGEYAGEIGSGMFLAFVAAGVSFIVRGGMLYGLTNVENYNQERANEKWERENPRVNQICGIIMLIATAIGLLLLFGGIALSGEGYEHAGAMVGFFWVVWPIGGILCAIVSVAMRGNNAK